MHFKPGLNVYQWAEALEGVITAQVTCPEFLVSGFEAIGNINIVVHEPAFGIIGEPAEKDPNTRKPADYSMTSIVSRTLRKVVGIPIMARQQRRRALWDGAITTLVKKFEFLVGTICESTLKDPKMR